MGNPKQGREGVNSFPGTGIGGYVSSSTRPEARRPRRIFVDPQRRQIQVDLDVIFRPYGRIEASQILKNIGRRPMSTGWVLTIVSSEVLNDSLVRSEKSSTVHNPSTPHSDRRPTRHRIHIPRLRHIAIVGQRVVESTYPVYAA